MADAPQRPVGVVESEIADARVLLQHARSPRPRVEGDDVAQRVVVGCVEDGLGRGVEGEGRHGVEHRAFHIHETLDCAVLEGNRPHVADDARVVERSVESPGFRVEKGAGDRTKGAGRHVGVGRRGVAADQLEIPVLEIPFKSDPLAPRLVDRPAEDATELRGVVGLAALLARNPLDDFFGRVLEGEPRHETRAVQVRVRRQLEVDLHAFGDEAQRIVEAAVVPDHGPEHHFVVAALRPPDAARHERLEEHRAAFEVPARHGHPRRGQQEVEDALRVKGDRGDLAGENSSEESFA